MEDKKDNSPNPDQLGEQKPVSELYPEAYKGALRADPTVEFKKKSSFWSFLRRDSDSFLGMYIFIVIVVIFGLFCSYIVYKQF